MVGVGIHLEEMRESEQSAGEEGREERVAEDMVEIVKGHDRRRCEAGVQGGGIHDCV
jgi:hypothetical protein